VGGVKVEKKYSYANLQNTFQKSIDKQYDVESEVKVTSRMLADLDNDGISNDVAGSAVLKIGRRFKSFLFFMKDDGAIRYLESNGEAFSAKENLSTLYCSDKPVVCWNNETIEKAASKLATPTFYLMEWDKKQAGLEVVIPYRNGDYGILNSLALFAGS